MKELTTLIKSSIMDVWQGPKYVPECPSAELFKNLAINTKMLGQIVPRLMLIRIITLDPTPFTRCFSLFHLRKEENKFATFHAISVTNSGSFTRTGWRQTRQKNLNQFLLIILGLKVSNHPKLKTHFSNCKETYTNIYNLGWRSLWREGIAIVRSENIYSSSHRRRSIEEDVLKNLAKLTGKHLWQSLFFH